MIYRDDDSAQALLVRLLTGEGHDVVTPNQAGAAGRKDPVHFMFALGDGRVILTRNHEDFEQLHQLVLKSGGHHPGVWTVRCDNDPSRDMRPAQIVRAIRRLIAAGVSVPDELNVLNHWR